MANMFRKILHVPSGQEFDLNFTEEANFVETMELDGPKLILTFTDPYGYLKDKLKVKEFDELQVTMSDFFWADGINENLSFTILSCPTAGHYLKYNLLSTPVFQLKQMADKSRIFRQRGINEIIGALVPGVRQDLESFPIVEDYHVLAGERGAALLRHYAEERGSVIWMGRDAFHVRRFKTLFNEGPAFEYHHGKAGEKYTIANYKAPSAQAPLQETHIRKYTGWNDDRGRIQSPPAGALAKAKKAPPVILQSQHIPTLGSEPTATRIAIDFMCHGNGFLTAGMPLKLIWHQVDPERPINEALPEKIVIRTIAHYFVSQTYTCRVWGAVPLEAAY